MEEGVKETTQEIIRENINETLEEDEKKAIEKPESLLSEIKKAFPGREQDIRSYSPLALAYMGDAVYEMVIRTMLLEQANRPVRDLHRYGVRYVSAGAQSRIVQGIMEDLTEEEQAVYRRGRNAKPKTMAKSASAAEYLRATGFEAVVGYLYLTDRMDRALFLIRKGVGMVDSSHR
jgi:ribonuclease-3 family protein